MPTRISTAAVMSLGVSVGIFLLASPARAEEEKALRPEIQNMMQSVGERLQAAADKLELSADQRAKIREINASYAEKRKALRAERHALLQDELKALGTVLTPDQREKAKDLVEDRMEQIKESRPGLPRFAGLRETLADRIESAGEKIGITSEQREQICKTLASQADRHAALRARCREMCEQEFKEVAALLTPDQRQKAWELVEVRFIRAPAVKSVADRIEAMADKLGLTADQRRQMEKAHSQFAGKYRELRSERRRLLQDELKAINPILTPEQREMVREFWEDRIVMKEGPESAREAMEAAGTLKQSLAERLEAVGNKLGLTAEQRNEIHAASTHFADKFKAQREQRRTLRQEELKALGQILTPEQRDQVKDFVEDQSETL